MSKLLLTVIIALSDAQVLLAQEAGGAAAPQLTFAQRMASMLPMFIIVFFIFYFLVLRPQASQLREHQKLISSLKKGEFVVTSGGLIGRVAGIEKDYILLDVAKDVKIKVESAHISKRLPSQTASK